MWMALGPLLTKMTVTWTQALCYYNSGYDNQGGY